MTDNHTPGPWALYDMDAIFADDTLVCEVSGLTPAELNANARLIAQAPAMLEALTEAEFLLSQLANYPQDVTKLLHSLRRSSGDIRAILDRIEGRL